MTKKTRIFMTGSAAVLAGGLCTGLVAYYGGRIPSARGLDRADRACPTSRPTRRSWLTPTSRASCIPSSGSGSSSRCRCRWAKKARRSSSRRPASTSKTTSTTSSLPPATSNVPGNTHSERRRGRARPVRYRQARGPGPRAWRPGPGIQGQAAPDPRARIVQRRRASRVGHRRQPRRTSTPPARPASSRSSSRASSPSATSQRAARDRRAAQRAEHHQQQRDDGPRQGHRAVQQRVGRRPFRPALPARRSSRTTSRARFRPSSGWRSPGTSTAAFRPSCAPRPTTTRPPRTSAASSTASSPSPGCRVRTTRSSPRSSIRCRCPAAARP